MKTIYCGHCNSVGCDKCLKERIEAGLPTKADGNKLQYSLIPPIATKALAEVLTFGAKKYKPNNWQLVEDGEARYTAALMRHFEAYRDGEDLDPESGMSHLSHVLTNATFLLYLQNKRLEGE